MQRAGKNDDYSSIADVDGIFIPAGDPAGEDEPVKKGAAFQVRAFGKADAWRC